MADIIYKLYLYVVEQEVLLDTPVVKNVRQVLESLFEDRYRLEIIDVAKNPQAAVEEGILFTPTLLRLSPPPKKRVIGNFLDREKILQSLYLLR